MVVPDWENRVGSSFQGAPTTERFYFFEQAYKDYLANSNQQAPAPIPFAEVEKKLDNTYNPEFTSILNEHNVATNGKNCIDPFNDSDVSGLTTQLCGLGTQYKGGQPFVDLCIILNKHEMAFDFAKQHNEKYAILDLITSCSVEARVKVFHDSAAEQMITCHTDDNQDAIRLSALVYRAVEQEQSAFELIVAELWSMGYRWDAFCLIQLKQRGSKFANILEVYTRKYIPNGEPIPSKPSIIQSLVKSVLEEAVVEVDPILLKDENPIHLYRLLKSSMMKNELCENDFDKLAGRRNTPTRLRQIILATLIKIGPKEAVLMTEDIFAYLKTNPCLLTDCFYILHRMMFLLTVGMIADVYEAIQKATSSNASVERAMVDKIKFDWEKRDFNFWIDDRRPVVFKEICSSLAETLATIRPYCESSHSVNFAYGQLAIAMSNVIASGTRSSNDREALASLVRETAGIPSDSKGQITSAIQDTAQPKTTAPSSEEEHNIKVNSLESSGPAVSDITVESNEVPDISSHHRSQPSTKSVSAPVLTIGADEARTEEEPKANIVKPDENTVPKEDAANAEEPTAIKSSTVLNLKSGGFEIQDSQKSRFGMYEVGRTQQSSLPSHYNEKRGGFGSRGGRGSAQFQGGRGGNTNGFRGSSSTGFGGFAVVSSAKAEHYLAERGFPSSAYLLTPFSTHTFNMKDPVGRLLPTTVTLDFRDMSKHGHLSPAVLPHVLKKALNSGNNLTVSVANYVECLQRFAGPSELDTFRSFIACIFVISSRDEHPLVELNRLTQLLQSQQHAPKQLDGLRSSPYTSMKWLSANTPKQYVLLHDCTHDEEAKTTECFQQMCAIYGPSYCQILRIGQGISDGLPDIWNRVDSLSRLLDTGVREAFNTTEVSPSVGNRRKHLSELDREECKYLVETFLKKILIPFAERLMRTLAEQLADRRRIGKFMMNGLDGMRKWLGTGQQQEIYNSVTFAPDCKEMKSRRLADLAFQFGLYAYAHEQYQTARKDFEQCQAWLYYASACEMSAVTLRRADPYQSAKYFPVRYLEDAIRHMINGAASQISITLCAINASRILSELQLPKEAALLLTRISSLDNGHFSAILQIYTARCYEKANMNRKAAFYYILAGDCLIKEGMKPVALESYRHALDYYIKDDGAFWPISNKYRTEPESEEIY